MSSIDVQELLQLVGDESQYSARLKMYQKQQDDLQAAHDKLGIGVASAAELAKLKDLRKSVESQLQETQRAHAALLSEARDEARKVIAQAHAAKDAMALLAGEQGAAAERLLRAAESTKLDADTYAKEVRFQADFDRAEAKTLLEQAQAKVDSLNAFRSAW